jgi:WD40 repeat protein/energy-coupling factor transporter ATP-binding protein EcfA2
VELGYTSSLEPYPGLRPFRKDESDIFFGRDDHIGEMIAKLSERHFLCVTGSSGCGKSSLAKTGLMNHLEAGFLAGRGSDWIFCDLTPGDHPINTLFRKIAEAIVAEVPSEGGASVAERCEQIREFLKNHIIRQRRTSDLNKALDLIAGVGDRPIMILVDQFEELFRYARSGSEAAVDFVDILLNTVAAQRNVYIVITIRTDELEKCSRYPGLTGMINDSQFLTPVLDRYQIQEAIEGPISLWNGSISPELSTWLLNCLEEELDKLPLMQHALRVLYAEKTSSGGPGNVTIDLDDFRRVFKLPPDLDLFSAEGRIALRRSLSDRLTERYNTLEDRLKAPAARAFCALTAIESRTRDIRQPQELGTLAKIINVSVEDTRTIVCAFSTGDEAYLRCNPDLAEDDTVDVTHECILRLWVPLQAEWLVEEKRSAEDIVSLARLARDWSSGSGNILSRAFSKSHTWETYHKWFDKIGDSRAWAIRYLGSFDWPAPSNADTPKLSADSIFDGISELLVASRQQKILLIVALSVVVVALAAGVLYSTNEIEKAKDRAARSVYDTLDLSGRPVEKTRISNLHLAVRALDEGWLPNAGLIWTKLQRVHELFRFNAQHEVHAADFAADGKSVLAVDYKGTLYQWGGTRERKVLRQVVIGAQGDDGRGQGRSLRVSPLGDVAAVGFNDGAVILVDLTSTDNKFKPLKFDNGSNPHGTESVFNLAFSHDGSLLVTTSRLGNLAIWERTPPAVAQSVSLTGGDPLQWSFKRNVDLKKEWPKESWAPAEIWAVDIDRAKQTIAVGLGNGHICLLRLDDLDRKPVCPNERTKDKAVKSVKFHPNKSILASAGNDSRVSLWDLDSLTEVSKPFFTHDLNNSVWDVDFNRDGTLLATADSNGFIRIYQTDPWGLLNTMSADSIDWAPSRTSAKVGTTADIAVALRTVRFDSTSTMLVTSSLDHTARVWTPLVDRTGILELNYRLPPAEERRSRSVYSVAIKPTGDGIAFTDQTAVYVQSSGKQPEPLPLDVFNASQSPRGTGGLAEPTFSQVLMRGANEIIVSAGGPWLGVWTLTDRNDWVARSVALPGDKIESLPADAVRQWPDRSRFPGRGAAIDASGTILAVEVRDGERASILLCPLGGSEAWTCSASGGSAITTLALDAKLLRNGTDNDCASRGSEVHIAISRDGRWVAASAGKCAIQVFDLHNGNRSRRCEGFKQEIKGEVKQEIKGQINTVDFSPDGKSLVAASQSGEVLVWDLERDETTPRMNINHHGSPYVTAARYSPSGQRIVSTSNDNSLIVSSATTGDKLVTLSFRNSLFDVEIASSGTMMVTGSEAGDVNVMRWFENDTDVVSYAKSVLQDVSP